MTFFPPIVLQMTLAKQGVDKVVPFVPSILCNCWA